jgi:hypothetical protein
MKLSPEKMMKCRASGGALLIELLLVQGPTKK